MEKQSTTSARKRATKSPLTLLNAIERVAELSNDSKLSAKFFTKARTELNFLATSYGITTMQAALLCICLERGPRHLDFDDIARHIDIGHIAVLRYADDIDALVRRKLILYNNAREADDFYINPQFIRCLKRNQVYELPRLTGLTCADFFEQMRVWVSDLNNDSITPAQLADEVAMVIADNQQMHFAKRVQELGLNYRDCLLLLMFCHLLVNNDDERIGIRDLECVINTRREAINTLSELRSGEHNLMQLELVEWRNDNGLADTNTYKLTEKAKADLLSELNIRTCEPAIANLVKPESLTAKTLFFGQKVQERVDELEQLLQPKQFGEIVDRLHQHGLRGGFACLFYGAPGTGKTETVYQLARRTGRPIMTVDVPEIKSKWVGDSEKNIKAVFERYRDVVGKSALAPILLFNEADAIIGKRKEGAENAVDKMENAIQNIILQEIEKLDGILIATTNLADNFDTAFERRFLYKIHFEHPDAKVRARIMRQMIPDLGDADALTLAKRYQLSGGQIENVSRRHTVATILHGPAADLLQRLDGYCRDEHLDQKQVASIGFAGR